MSYEPVIPEPAPDGGGSSLRARVAVDTRALRHKDFRNLWLGQTISTIGGMIGTVAVPYQMYA